MLIIMIGIIIISKTIIYIIAIFKGLVITILEKLSTLALPGLGREDGDIITLPPYLSQPDSIVTIPNFHSAISQVVTTFTTHEI